MPSGLLNGRGCFDSLQKCQDEAPLFLSIRHHGTSFVLEQRKKIDPATVIIEENFDDKVKEQFVKGALPILRSIIKFFFLVFIFPFHFCLFRLPILVKKLVTPIATAIQKVVLSVTRPIAAFFKRVFSPIIVLYRKITAIYQRILGSANAYLGKCKILFRRVKLQINSVVFDPPKRVIRKVKGFVLHACQKCRYGAKFVRAWTKLLIQYGFQLVRAQGNKILEDSSKD